MARPATDHQGVVALPHVLGHALCEIQLFAQLIHVEHLQLSALANNTALGLKLPQQQLEQGRLAAAVGTDDADLVPPHDAGAEIADHRPVGVAEADCFRLHHQPPGAGRLLQLHAGRVLPAAALTVLLAQRLQSPHAAFVAGTAGLDPLPDPGLFLGQLLVEQGHAGDLGLQQRLAPLHKLIVTTGKGKDTAAVQLGNAIRQPPGKGPVVGHKQAGSDVPGQKLLQPEDGVDIQVVGGLVQEQDVGVADQGPGQQHPPLGAAGKGCKLRLALQLQPVQDPLHLLFVLPLLAIGCGVGMLSHHLEHRAADILGNLL